MQCSISTKHVTTDQVIKVPFTQVLKLAFDHLVTTGCEGKKRTFANSCVLSWNASDGLANNVLLFSGALIKLWKVRSKLEIKYFESKAFKEKLHLFKHTGCGVKTTFTLKANILTLCHIYAIN